jgi:predicted N-acetyltransferase YhbS
MKSESADATTEHIVPMRVTIRHYQEGDELEILSVLNGSFGGRWGSLDMWNAKYKKQANFDPECLIVAEYAGRIIGCCHSMIQHVSFQRGQIPIGVFGDMAITPGHRGRRLFKRLTDHIEATLMSKGCVLNFAFASPELALGVYIRYPGAFSITRYGYTYCLNSRPFQEKISSLNHRLSENSELQKHLLGITLAVQFYLTAIPPFTVIIKDGAISLADGRVDTAQIVVRGEQGPVINALRSPLRGGNRRDLITAIMRGRVRISGWLTILPLLRTLLRVIR